VGVDALCGSDNEEGEDDERAEEEEEEEEVDEKIKEGEDKRMR
jgi:hypothetical protein